jgi:hypothetical protein
MAVSRAAGGAQSRFVRSLPLVPARVNLEEVGEQPRERLSQPAQTLAPRLVQAHRQSRVLGRQPLV